MRELLKENCKYKLYLLELLGIFEEIKKDVKGNENIEFKKFCTNIIKDIKNILDLKDEKINFDVIKKIMDEEKGETK